MLRALRKIFEWQRNSSTEDGHYCERFTLMLTTHLEERVYQARALDEMKAIAAENIERHEPYSEAFSSKFGHADPYALTGSDFPTFFSVTFPKVVAPIARQYGWFGEHRKIYIYARNTRGGDPYFMMSSVVNYEKLPSGDDSFTRLWSDPNEIDQEYVREMCNIVTYKPVDVIQQLQLNSTTMTAVVQDLQDIVSYRNAFVAVNMQ
jgi:hypothetical protein